MATGFGIDRGQYALPEGRIQIGDWAPGSVDTSTPLDAFTVNVDLGDFQQGSLNPQLQREFTEFLVGTPAKIGRKDLIRKQWMWEATLAQFNDDLLGLVQALDVDSGTYSVAWIGSDEPTQSENGYAIVTNLMNGAAFVPAMWFGRCTAEQVGPAFTGTAHATYQFKAEAFEHTAFISAPNDAHNLGAFLIGPTPS